MSPGFVVSGRILDPAGVPLAAAEFYVQDPSTGTELYTPTDLTDALGIARFVLPVGTYDFIGVPPLGPLFAARAVRQVAVGESLQLGDVNLPAGVPLSAHLVTPAGAAIEGVECRADSLPSSHPLAMVNARADAAGLVSVVVTPGPLRVTFLPPVATRRLPAVFENVSAAGGSALGDVVLSAGHWLDLHVREASSGLAVPGASFELIEAATGAALPTVAAAADANGDARVTVGTGAYRLRVRAPGSAGGSWNDGYVLALRSAGDTSIVVLLTHPGLAVPPRPSEAAFALGQPWPNPVRGCVQLAAECSVLTRLELSVWDVSGRQVRRAPPVWTTGRATLAWDARDGNGARVAPGSYWLRVGDGRNQAARRVFVITN
jgi:hypothetical protein